MEPSERLDPDMKKEIFTDILTRDFSDRQMPEALFSFSGGIEKNPNTGRYKTTTFTHFGEHGQVTGGRTRAIATAEVARVFPDLKIVTTSHYYKDEPSHASVIAEELIRRGVEEERISLEEESMSTITQLVEMIKTAVKNNWREIVAITNGYHLARMQEMYRQLGNLYNEQEFQEALRKFQEMKGEVGFFSSDEILTSISGHWEDYFNKVKETPAYRATVEAEARGLKDLREGRYQVRTTTKPKTDTDPIDTV